MKHKKLWKREKQERNINQEMLRGKTGLKTNQFIGNVKRSVKIIPRWKRNRNAVEKSRRFLLISSSFNVDSVFVEFL